MHPLIRVVAASVLAGVTSLALAATTRPIAVTVVPDGTPYVATINCTWTNQASTGDARFEVPAGNLFTISTVGYFHNQTGSVPPPGSFSNMILFPTLAGTATPVPFPSIAADGLQFVGTQVQTTLLADSSGTLRIKCYRTSEANGADQLTITFTGVLTPLN